MEFLVNKSINVRGAPALISLLEDPPTERLVFRRDDCYLLNLPWMYYYVLDSPKPAAGSGGRWRTGTVVGAYCSPTQRRLPADPFYYIPLPTIERNGEAGIQLSAVEIDAPHTAMIGAALDKLFVSRGCGGIDSHIDFTLCEPLFARLCPIGPRSYAKLLGAWEKCTPEEVIELPWPKLPRISPSIRGRMHDNLGELIYQIDYHRQPLLSSSERSALLHKEESPT